jgi:hypothetical protein
MKTLYRVIALMPAAALMVAWCYVIFNSSPSALLVLAFCLVFAAFLAFWAFYFNMLADREGR